MTLTLTQVQELRRRLAIADAPRSTVAQRNAFATMLRTHAPDLLEIAERSLWGQWQPITTAPEGRNVIVWRADRLSTFTAYRAGSRWFHFGGFEREFSEAPTHWMPLPTTPTNEKES